MADPIDLRTPVSSLRGARRAQPVQTFDLRAAAAADFRRPPFDDGDAFRAAGRTFAAVGGVLSDLADAGRKQALAAEVEAARAQGATDAAAAVGMPKLAAGDAASLIRDFEGFRENAYWDVNAHRAGFGSDTVTGPDGRVTRVTPATRVSRADAERDLTRRVAEFSGIAERQVGSDRWAALPPAAQAALTSVAYNYGNLPQRIVPAVRNGDLEEIANAVRGLAGDNAGINQRRRNREAEIIAGGGLTVTLPKITPLQLRRDGTPQGEAYDAAVKRTGMWRAKAAMQTGLDALADQHAGDPAAFAQAAQELRQRYVGAFENDRDLQELQATADAEFELNFQPLLRQAFSTRDQAAARDMKAAAAEAVVSQLPVLERQAYALGANADGDNQLTVLEGRAGALIDSALLAGAMSPAEASRQRQAVAGTLIQARFDGVFDALATPAEKRAFAERLGSPEMRRQLTGKMAGDDYATLVSRYRQMARQASETEDATLRVERARFARLISDDVASIGATGQGVMMGGLPLAPADVARVLGEDEAARWSEQRGQALQLFAATDGLERLTPDQIAARLQALEPQPGAEGFAQAQALYGRAAKAVDAVLKQRAEDPAAAADAAFPALRDPAMRENPAELAAARLLHQEAMGVPAMARQPLTNAEARRYAARLAFYTDDDPAQAQVISGLVNEIQSAFGPNADEAMAQVLRVNGVTREASRQGAALLGAMSAGQPMAVDSAAAMDAALSRDRAERAMQGAPPAASAPAIGRGGVTAASARAAAARPAAGGGRGGSPARRPPNTAAIEYLRANPDQAQYFDQKYGQGLAERFLAAAERDRRSRMLPDGSRETVYDDGWVETIRPDGTVDGRQM